MTRDYSNESRASAIFQDLLSSITERGWFSSGPGGDANSMLYVSFHVHPGDSQNVMDLINKSISRLDRGVKWVVKVRDGNRFFMCPKELSLRSEEIGNFDSAYSEFLSKNDKFPEQAAESLITLADFIYEEFKKTGRERFVEK